MNLKVMFCFCVISLSENPDWWLARHTTTQLQGYIPSNYIVEDDNTPESQELVINFTSFLLISPAIAV